MSLIKYDFINLVIADKFLDDFVFESFLEDGELYCPDPFFLCYDSSLDKKDFHHFLRIEWKYKVTFLRNLTYE